MKKMKEQPILELDGVAASEGIPPRSGRLMPGGHWLWTDLEDAARCERWADIIQGMAEPFSGRVAFLGGDPARARNRVGRVFSGTAFVSNLTIEENLFVVPAFESRLALRLAEERVRQILDRCGVRDICTERPVALNAPDRLFWQWVRALSRPRDLFLFEDAFTLPQERLSPLRGVLEEEIGRGAAFVGLSYFRGDSK